MFYGIIGICAIAVIAGLAYYRLKHRVFGNKVEGFITDLDHDITVPDAKLIINEVKTGFDVEVGPTGWPIGVNQKWEITLWEDHEYYYARLIYHEYILWWSFDDPYILCKIPKINLTGDMQGDYKYRYQVLWDITYTTYRNYDYKNYMPNAKVEAINGHTVDLGGDKSGYYKYLVICDKDHQW